MPRVVVPGVGQPSHEFSVRYQGNDVEAYAGDTIASALVAAGHLVCRETHDGSPRGIFCGMGACSECAVVVDGEAGHLACMVQVREGMAISVQPAKPNLQSSLPRTVGKSRTREPSVLVVGGGPAGLSAAAIIAESGVDVVLLDERSKLGGQFFKQPATQRKIDSTRLDAQYRHGRELIARVRNAGVEVISGANLWGAFAPDFLVADDGECSWTLRPQRLILATGAVERGVPIPGWTLPGVMTTGAAQALLRSSQVSPGEKVLLSGNGPLNLQVASELVRAGVEVVALAEQADLRWWKNVAPLMGVTAAAPTLAKKGLVYRTQLMRAGVPVFSQSAVVEIRGEGAVESAVVARIDRTGRPIVGTEREFVADAVCLGFGFVPSNEIPRALGCSHHFDEHTGSLTTTTGPTGRTSIDTVWIVGDAGEINGAYAAQAMGELAGADVVADLTGPTPRNRAVAPSRQARKLTQHLRFQRSLRKIYAAHPMTTQLAKESTIVCRCESVSLGDLRRAFADGAASPGAAKRVTRAGMGKCQGRYCGPALYELAEQASGIVGDEYSAFAPQPPVRPVEIGRVAGTVKYERPGTQPTAENKETDS